MLTRDDLVGPWAGLPVAWDENLLFDEDAYRADVERTAKAGVPGIYTAGTTGEFYAMEFAEWQAVTRATVEECRRLGTPVMIGVTATYTLGAVRRAAFAAELGADAIQVALPFWMEVDDADIVPFFREVAGACPGLAMTLYETRRCKKVLTVDQHRAIAAACDCYLAVKANADTVGRTPAGCAALSEFINVWVGENCWHDLGPHGANGCASSLVYMNPRVLLHMFELLCARKWPELAEWTAKIDRLFDDGLGELFAGRRFLDTAEDRLSGAVTGFLRMNVRARGPYPSATTADVQRLRNWMEANVPELLVL